MNRGARRVGDTDLAERIRDASSQLAPAERRVARTVLAGYPMAGLETVATLAERAGTSPPTVLRLLSRLGFDGYPAFQRAIKAELAARLTSPVDLYPADAALGGLAATVREPQSTASQAARSHRAGATRPTRASGHSIAASAPTQTMRPSATSWRTDPTVG